MSVDIDNLPGTSDKAICDIYRLVNCCVRLGYRRSRIVFLGFSGRSCSREVNASYGFPNVLPCAYQIRDGHSVFILVFNLIADRLTSSPICPRRCRYLLLG